MSDSTNIRPTGPAISSPAYKQLTDLIGKALLSVKNIHGSDIWKLHSVLAAEVHPAGEAEPAGVVRLVFQGAVEGSLLLQIQQDGADQLFEITPGEATGQGAQQGWLNFVQSAEPALKQLLAVDFGAPVLSGERPGPTADLTPIGELELRVESGSAAAKVIVLVDAAMRASLERLSITGGAGMNAIVRGRHDEKQLHRVIDVPLAVTLRFGQRQMTLRELLALTTGSLVELDRQVEEPVDLMLGERVLARGEVVIVDGNYGLRITEIVEKQVPRELTAAA